MSGLPIDALRADFDARRGRVPLVVSAPTGSGKSTQIPRWCRAAGRVLVVEPRRVACRSLAQRVAELEGVSLGAEVGYRVRDDDRSSARTEILFVTPGVALRMRAGGLDDWATVVLDEFHERSLDLDLLLALLHGRGFEGQGGLVVMSATLEGDRVAEHLGGEHLRGEGRTFPVEVRHRASGALLPEPERLGRRVADALRAAADDPGDVLVFLPGKAEIAAAERALGSFDVDLLPLHGGLSLENQSRVFRSTRRRKVVLTTNVAETSLTVPGVGVVIDSGLVRRTHYHGGRGFLTLRAVALDAAEQRAGRAGRTAPGVCYRLWSAAANLRPHTPPEIHRESLVPLVLAAAACDAATERLPFLDPPKAHALAAARAELEALGALEGDGLSPCGRQLFGLPVDAPLGRLLVEARGTPAAEDVVDLVAALAVGRPLFRRGFTPTHAEDDLREPGCDATAFVRAVRSGRPDEHGLVPHTLKEARRISRRLRKAFGLPPKSSAGIDRRALAEVALTADPRSAHVARRRKRKVAWSNGGTELVLARDSAVAQALDAPGAPAIDAVVVFESRAFGTGRDAELTITCAMPVPLAWLVAAKVGRVRVARAKVARGRIVAQVERVHARKVLDTWEETPRGEAAREALARVFLEGRLWRDTLAEARDRLEARALNARLNDEPAPPALDDWVRARVAELGVETGEDLALLSPDDLLPEPLPEYVRTELDRLYPRRIELPDAEYRVVYEPERRRVTLERVAGRRRDPPPRSWLPSFRGFRVRVRHDNVVHEVK